MVYYNQREGDTPTHNEREVEDMSEKRLREMEEQLFDFLLEAEDANDFKDDEYIKSIRRAWWSVHQQRHKLKREAL